MKIPFFADYPEDETFTRLHLNPFTLSFRDNNEVNFKNKYFEDNIKQFRLSFLLVTMIYAGFGYLDSRIDQQYVNTFHFLRYAVITPSFGAVLIFSFSSYFKKIWQTSIFISLIISGFCGAILTLLAADNYAYYAGMMVIFSAGYFFIKLRFLLAAIAGWLILIFFNVAALTFARIQPEMLLINNFFFIATNLIGMFAAHNIEFYTRKGFFLNQELDYRNAEIIEANKNLESKVEVRTKELVLEKERAEESDNLKTAFLNNISHEIRTPFNGILGFLSLMQEDILTDSERQRYFKIINKSSERLIKTINDIVEISQIHARQIEIRATRTNVIKLADLLIDQYKNEAESKGLELTLNHNLPNNAFTVFTDEEKLNTILSNLIDNAIKFTRAGSILLFIEMEANTLKFSVKDTGIGIPKNKQQLIFERFVQVDSSDTRQFEGSGLGLTIAKAYVEMLGGSIWVESQEEIGQPDQPFPNGSKFATGGGTTFYFTIHPNGKQHETNNTNFAPTEILEQKKMKSIKILIAEDDLTSDIFLTTALKKLSKETLKEKTGIAAVETCRNNPDIDLVLMDIKMPVMDGYEATRQIRQFNKNVIIIAQTAYALIGDKDKALKAGCNDYIAKPIKKDSLILLLQKYFKMDGD